MPTAYCMHNMYVTHTITLNKYYVCTHVWQVIDGMEVLDLLEKVPTAGKKHKPEQDIRIEEVIIHANPLAT